MTGVNPRGGPIRLWLWSALALACAARAATPAGAPSPQYGGLERDVARRINAHRVGVRLPPLRYDSGVAAIARAHSREMAEHRVSMGHDGFQQRVATLEKRLPLTAVAENVAFNDYSPASTVRVAVTGWLASAHHLENIEGKYNVTGVGIARSRDGAFFYTQLFVAQTLPPARR